MVRRTLQTLLLLALALAPLGDARAGWASTFVEGTPRDVEVWAPGVFSVASVGAACLFDATGRGCIVSDDPLNPIEFVGTFYQPATGCFYALGRDGTRYWVSLNGSTCSTPGPVFGTGSTSALRMKSTQAGSGFAVRTNLGVGGELTYSATGMARTTAWQSLPESAADLPTPTMGVLRIGTTDHALFGVRPAVFLWKRSDALNASGVRFRAPSGLTDLYNPTPTEVELVPTGVPEPLALLATPLGLYRGRLTAAGNPTDGSSIFLPVTLPGAPPVATGVDLNTGAMPLTRGDGFGVATVRTSGGAPGWLSAQPVTDLAQAGLSWHVNPTFASGLPAPIQGAPLGQVRCVGSQYCVALSPRVGSSTVHNILVYENRFVPELDTPAPVTLDEGASGSARLQVSDPDGDAVLVTADVPPGPLAAAPVRDTLGWRVDLTAGGVCSTQVVEVPLTAGDGKTAHVETQTLAVTVRHTVTPGAPGVTPSSTSLFAGGPATTFTANGAPTGCAPSGFDFRPRPGAPALTRLSATQARLTPPPTLCQATPATYEYDVVAQDSAGDSTPTRVAATVAPWGVPRAPFTGPTSVSLQAGGRTVLAPDAGLHACAATPGFPGVATRWELVSPPPPTGVRLEGPDGGVVALPVDVAALTVASDDCVDATLQLRATHTTRDAAGLSGPPSDVTVSVATVLAPLTSSAVRITGTQARPDALSGTLETGLNCTARRNLRARLAVSREAGGTVASAEVPVPGPFTLPLPGGCTGGRYVLAAQLVDSTGTVASDAGFTFEVPTLPAALAGLTAAPLVARCGEGARTALTQVLPPEACQAVDLAWSVVPGAEDAAAELVDVAGAGATLRTLDTGLDALVGRTVRVQVTADAGAGNVARVEHVLPITVEPFVQVERRGESPTAAEGDVTGVQVALRNPEACAVTGVRLEERLEGASFVEGSARVDGVPVAATVEGGVLRVEGVSLPAGGGATLTYLVRPALLGRPRARGEASLRGVRISQDAGEAAAPEGCGCQGAGSGVLSAAGLLAWALVLRRRRPPAQG